MTTEHTLCPIGRRSGRTTWILTELIKAIREGQPKSVVLAANYSHQLFLVDMFLQLAKAAGMRVDEVDPCHIFNVEGSTVVFAIYSHVPIVLSSEFGWGQFWDHYTEESMVDRLNKNS